MNSARKYLLWDASVIVPYYIPSASSNARAASRSRIILEAVRNDRLDALCYIPNTVIAEVFTAFARDCFSGWDSQVYRKYGGYGKTLDTRRYNTARTKFRNDIHNAALFYQVEINRYHVLALDLIAPIDKHRKFYRRKRNVRSMSASDLLVGAVGIHLAKVHGWQHVAVLTADARMSAILANACPELNVNTANKLRLPQIADELRVGPWGPSLYPQAIDLQRCTDKALEEFFGEWPLRTRKLRGKPPKA